MTLRHHFDRTQDYYLYGATPAADGVMQLLSKHGKTIKAFVDRDPEKQSEQFIGKPVLSPDALFERLSPGEGVIIVSAYQQEIARFLRDNGVSEKQVFPMLDGMFLPTYGDHFLQCETLDRIAAELSTSEEQEYLHSWRQFKKDGNLADLKPMPSMQKQYEHHGWLSSLKPGGVAIDVGAFDGVTSIELAETRLFSKILAIEPFTANFNALEANFASASTSVELRALQLALGATRATISQGNEDVSSRSRIDLTENAAAADSEVINIVPLDELDTDNVSLIKVDVEGFELDFLAGASNTLGRCRPHLAVSAYHHKDHPSAIASFLYENYRGVHIRVGHHPTAIYELEYYVSFA